MEIKKPRQNTDDLLQLIEEGYLTYEIVLKSALHWMSDNEVGEMAHYEGFFWGDEDEDEDDEELYHCNNCGSEVIKEDVSLDYCIACKFSDNKTDNKNL